MRVKPIKTLYWASASDSTHITNTSPMLTNQTLAKTLPRYFNFTEQNICRIKQHILSATTPCLFSLTMMMIASRMNTLFLLVALTTTLLSCSQAFLPVAPPLTHHAVQLRMSSLPSEESELGTTERLLLEAKRRRENGLRQEYGLTIKKDGLDGIRAGIWALFHASNVVFPVLGIALSAGLLMNMMGYGYFFDGSGTFVVDSLDHIRQDKLFQEEALKMAATASETVRTMM
jgi:hypothetical protein